MVKKYLSPYDPNDPYNGLPVTVIGSAMTKRSDGGPDEELLTVLLPSGHSVTAWPEEVVDDDTV